MSDGWIKLYRQIEDCAFWESEPFSRAQAWICLLLDANHRDKSILFNDREIVIKRGQYLTSVRKLSEKFMWGKDKTLKFLRYLEEHQMITKDSDKHRTLITIVNYEVYQDKQDTGEDTDKDTSKDTSKDTEQTQTSQQSERKPDTDKPQTRKKECKNERNKYIVEIVEHLNEKTGKRYSAFTNKTVEHINGRMGEGYTVDDFKRVIDNKCREWLGTDMEKFLRPNTLFSPSHFEEYLNQGKQKQEKVITEPEHENNEPELSDEDWVKMMEQTYGQ